MAIHRNCNLAITLLFSLVVLLALAPPSSANAVSPDVPHRRDHVNLNRMIKKRAHPLLHRELAAAQLPPLQSGAVGAAADPSTDAASSPVPSSTPIVAAPSTTQAPEASQSPQPIPSVVPSVLSSAVSCFHFFFVEIFRVTNILGRHRLFRLPRARVQRAQLVPPHPLQRQAPSPAQLLPLLPRATQRRLHRHKTSNPLPRVNPCRLTR